MKVLICGSQKWADTGTIRQRVHELPESTIIIHGGAKGADAIAGGIAERRGLHVAEMRALWRRFDKRAGHIRNAAMLELDPDLVIAFTVGGELTAGTRSMVNRAKAAKVPVETHYGDGVVELPDEAAA